MTELNIEQVKLIQLDVLSAIHQFCCKNDIKYSLACGTLLGAKRHKGYIPWDDDIDIYLLREDYDTLMSSFPETYQGVYKITSLERDAKWNRAYAKGYHCGTIFNEASTSDYQLGVCIDIFPIDTVPQSNGKWNKYNRTRLFWQKIYVVKSIKISTGRSVAKNAILLFGKILIIPLSLKTIAKQISRVAQKYNGTKSDRVFENVCGVVSQRPFSRQLFDSISDVLFEDRVFKAFTNSDDYLTNTYGNWQELPPKEKRVTHHSFKAYRK